MIHLIDDTVPGPRRVHVPASLYLNDVIPLVNSPLTETQLFIYDSIRTFWKVLRFYLIHKRFSFYFFLRLTSEL
jgi:hypothetical protein